ncbi:F-box protein [Rhynchospora pubera]|uniref:F-box protein n=1 Tax=Rhynchospora pubera TaxID=906938 RepID=A0AAV8HFH0_9POAL|nr:F-box protein [Rhynchospora pubera]KAJ4815410.1 F-box protein [Rhynchospora pubera]
MDHWFYNEALKVVFPLLDSKDLASCMLVCRQWRDIASDDYIWKCICTQKWPSITKKPPFGTTYHRLFVTFCKPPLQPPLPLARLSLNDLVFYIDLWSDKTLIYSNAVLGSALLVGLNTIPAGISDVLRSHLENSDCKMLLQLEPKITIPQGVTVTASVLVARTDTDKMACIMHKSIFDYIDLTTSRALSYDYLKFSPRHPFVSDIRAWVSLLILTNGSIGMNMDVFGLEIDFCDVARSENEIIWLLDMLDWK